MSASSRRRRCFRLPVCDVDDVDGRRRRRFRLYCLCCCHVGAGILAGDQPLDDQAWYILNSVSLLPLYLKELVRGKTVHQIDCFAQQPLDGSFILSTWCTIGHVRLSTDEISLWPHPAPFGGPFSSPPKLGEGAEGKYRTLRKNLGTGVISN